MDTRRFIKVVVFGAVAGIALGCASDRSTARNAPPMRRGMSAEVCPALVENTTVTWTDVQGGVALVFFTTSPARVAEVRERARNLAQMHNAHQGAGMGAMMPESMASVDDVEGGASLVLRPRDATQLEQLREHSQDMANRMTRGECKMMHRGPTSSLE